MSNHLWTRGLILMILVILFNACVDVLDSEYSVDEPILVVQASLLDTIMEGMPETAPMQVNIFSLLPLESTYVDGGLESFGVTTATVAIIDTDNNTYPLSHQGAGLYTSDTQGKEGIGYQLLITLENGSIITSETEYMTASQLDQDSLSTISTEPEDMPTIDVQTLSHINNPLGVEAHYIYKSWREYEFREDPSLPFQKTCYISEPIDNRTVTISQVRADQTTITNTVSKMSYDSRFAFKLFFHIYQYHITPTTYDYYEQVELNKNQSDALFAPIPGKIRTNLTIEGDDTRDLQGYFTVASVEYSRVKTNPTILNQQVIFACPSNSSRPWSSNPLREYCADCLLYDNATLEKPLYW